MQYKYNYKSTMLYKTV